MKTNTILPIPYSSLLTPDFSTLKGTFLGLLTILLLTWGHVLAATQPKSADTGGKTQQSSTKSPPLSPSLRHPVTSSPSSTCPTNLEPLTSLLLKDLPSYTNRVIQRSRKLESNDGRSYVILAGKPEFEPLKLSQQQYTPLTSESPEQLFFTTLERQYFGNRVIDTENYHWVFLTQTPSGWRLVMMFSQLGNSDKEKPPLPPRETSNSAIGQGIQLWLRDCRAGAIKLKRI